MKILHSLIPLDLIGMINDYRYPNYREIFNQDILVYVKRLIKCEYNGCNTRIQISNCPYCVYHKFILDDIVNLNKFPTLRNAMQLIDPIKYKLIKCNGYRITELVWDIEKYAMNKELYGHIGSAIFIEFDEVLRLINPTIIGCYLDRLPDVLSVYYSPINNPIEILE